MNILQNLNISFVFTRNLAIISCLIIFSGCSVPKNISIGPKELAPSVSCLYEKKLNYTEVYGISRTCRKIVKTTDIPYSNGLLFVSKRGKPNINDFPYAIYEWVLSAGNPDEERSNLYDSPMQEDFVFSGNTSSFGIGLINKSDLIEKNGKFILPFTNPFKYPTSNDVSVNLIRFRAQNKTVEPPSFGKYVVTDYIRVFQIHDQCKGKGGRLDIFFTLSTEDNSYDISIDCRRPFGTPDKAIAKFNCKTRDECFNHISSKYQKIINNDEVFSDRTVPYYKNYKDWWINPSVNPFLINDVE